MCRIWKKRSCKKEVQFSDCSIVREHLSEKDDIVSLNRIVSSKRLNPFFILTKNEFEKKIHLISDETFFLIAVIEYRSKLKNSTLSTTNQYNAFKHVMEKFITPKCPYPIKLPDSMKDKLFRVLDNVDVFFQHLPKFEHRLHVYDEAFLYVERIVLTRPHWRTVRALHTLPNMEISHGDVQNFDNNTDKVSLDYELPVSWMTDLDKCDISMYVLFLTIVYLYEF